MTSYPNNQSVQSVRDRQTDRQTDGDKNPFNFGLIDFLFHNFAPRKLWNKIHMLMDRRVFFFFSVQPLSCIQFAFKPFWPLYTCSKSIRLKGWVPSPLVRVYFRDQIRVSYETLFYNVICHKWICKAKFRMERLFISRISLVFTCMLSGYQQV